jgi:UDP-glucuronate 4-epimerase
MLIDGQPIPVFGDGTTRRDYTFVDDIVAGILGAMRYEASPFEVINLGNNRAVGLLELIDNIADVVGERAELKWLPMQPGDVPQTWASVEKASRLLDYRPATTIRAGLETFVRWLRDPDGGAARPAVSAAIARYPVDTAATRATAPLTR